MSAAPSTPSAGRQLATLPGPVQARLWALTAALAGMDSEEQTFAVAAMVEFAEQVLTIRSSENTIALMRLMAVLGELAAEMHRQAGPHEVRVTVTKEGA